MVMTTPSSRRHIRIADWVENIGEGVLTSPGVGLSRRDEQETST